jgi:hypothetical protein
MVIRNVECRMSNTVEVGRSGIDPFGGREGASRIFGGKDGVESKRSSIHVAEMILR